MGAEIGIFGCHHRAAQHRSHLLNIDPLILYLTKSRALLHHVKSDRRVDPSVDQPPSKKDQRNCQQTPKQDPAQALQHRPQAPRPPLGGVIGAIKRILTWLSHIYATSYQKHFVNVSEFKPRATGGRAMWRVKDDCTLCETRPEVPDVMNSPISSRASLLKSLRNIMLQTNQIFRK